MNTRLAGTIALVAAVHLLGGHWVVLQTVAWSGMFAAYTQDFSLGAAIGKTFDGGDPCSLCDAVKTGRDQERDAPFAESNTKLDAVLTKAVALASPASAPSTSLGDVTKKKFPSAVSGPTRISTTPFSS
ncbi:MAG: hypothetical protein WD342_14850 [Verrucomicrobiales bacterium]